MKITLKDLEKWKKSLKRIRGKLGDYNITEENLHELQEIVNNYTVMFYTQFINKELEKGKMEELNQQGER